ncbi:hypothetical protein BB559_006130 [Furculomyces boomerangus]|uniref:Uncharacterized protein n=2 Tax=Harpellales TaxID=61421 RepID=A0A2T9Y4M9_9FUNG|nr:hypothetical protein BB559_006130 [Furculomyces boomerangus]PVZ96696.1 hypothetical protein BB558_007383 [Smittium angustum]PVZ99570.1 hypothetical protein BB558_004397 [Smittium angustum]
MPSNILLKAAAILGATSIGLGAYGSHGIRNIQGITERQIESWSTASKYQQFSALSLLCLYSISKTSAIKPKTISLSAALIFSGSLMFSGSIYLLVLNRDRFKFLGPVTPIGGLALMAGWLALLF